MVRYKGDTKIHFLPTFIFEGGGDQASHDTILECSQRKWQAGLLIAETN